MHAQGQSQLLYLGSDGQFGVWQTLDTYYTEKVRSRTHAAVPAHRRRAPS